MNTYSAFLLLLVMGVLAGCNGDSAGGTPPKTFLSGGTAFSYPANWKITEDSPEGDVRSIIVEGPESSMAVILLVPAEGAGGVLDHAKRFSKDAAAELTAGGVSASVFEELPESGGFTWVRDRFSITLLGQRMPYLRLHGGGAIGDKAVVLTFQAAEEDMAEAKPGFDLIAGTLKSAEEETGD